MNIYCFSSRKMLGIRSRRSASCPGVGMEMSRLPSVQRLQTCSRTGNCNSIIDSIQYLLCFFFNCIVSFYFISSTTGHGSAVLRVRHDFPPLVLDFTTGDDARRMLLGLWRLSSQRVCWKNSGQGQLIGRRQSWEQDLIVVVVVIVSALGAN